ncbi:hypothetical protein ACEPAG_2642 [Sanghuangporus baumii]
MTCLHEATLPEQRDRQRECWTCCSDCDIALPATRTISVPNLLEQVFRNEVIESGIDKRRKLGDESYASKYALNWADLLPEIESRKQSILYELSTNSASSSLECRMGTLLDEIGAAIGERLGIPRMDMSGEFTCQFSFSSVGDNRSVSNADKPPELALTVHEFIRVDRQFGWGLVIVPVLFRRDQDDFNWTSHKLLAFARHIWEHTYSRRFVIGIAFGKADFHVMIFGQSGVMISREYGISDVSDFARLIVGLLFANEEELGYDSSMNGLEILVNGNGYTPSQVCGRQELAFEGITCVLAKRCEDMYAVKDVWLEEGILKPREVDILERISDIENVPRIVEYELLKTSDGAVDSTDFFKKGGTGLPTLNHFRYVMKPVGTHLNGFTCLEELISVIRDIVKVIKDLHEHRILHADIRYDHVILVPDSGSPSSLRKACLIDFAYAIDLEDSRYRYEIKATTSQWFYPQEIARAAAYPCISIKRGYYHDLESTLYLLCFVCLAFKGPNSGTAPTYEPDSPLLPWHYPTTPYEWEAAYLDRSQALTSRNCFHARILRHFHPYFEDVKECVLKMYDVLFPDVLDTYQRYNAGITLRCLFRKLQQAQTQPDLIEDIERKQEMLQQIHEYQRRLAIQALADQAPVEVFNKLFVILDDTLDMLRSKS